MPDGRRAPRASLAERLEFDRRDVEHLAVLHVDQGVFVADLHPLSTFLRRFQTLVLPVLDANAFILVQIVRGVADLVLLIGVLGLHALGRRRLRHCRQAGAAQAGGQGRAGHQCFYVHGKSFGHSCGFLSRCAPPTPGALGTRPTYFSIGTILVIWPLVVCTSTYLSLMRTHWLILAGSSRPLAFQSLSAAAGR